MTFTYTCIHAYIRTHICTTRSGHKGEHLCTNSPPKSLRSPKHYYLIKTENKRRSAMQSHSRVYSGSQTETQLDGSVWQLSTEGGGKCLRLLAAACRAAPLTILRHSPIHSATVKLETARQHSCVVYYVVRRPHGWHTTRKCLQKHKIRASVFVHMPTARLITTGFQRLFLSAANQLWTMLHLSSTHYRYHYGPGDAPHDQLLRGSLIHLCQNDAKL